MGQYRRPLKVLIPRPHQAVYNNMFIVQALESQLKNGDLKLTFPAWGDGLLDFKKHVNDNGLNEYIEYYPFLNRDKYIGFIAGFDIYLSASKSDSSPASLIEAMASGLLPAVGNIPGVREWADHSSCLLFENDNEYSLQKVIGKIINGLDNVDRLLQKNHERVKATALFDDNIEQTIKLIESQIAEGK